MPKIPQKISRSPDADHPIHIDLHVHTNRYSACAESLSPEMLKERMVQRNLHGLVITEHDCMWSQREIIALNRALHPLRAFRGIEVSSANGHFVVIGITRPEQIRPGISASALLHEIERQRAVMILVHHHLVYSQTRQPLDISLMPAGIHAIEVASTATTGKAQREAIQIATERGWREVAGSDAHAIQAVGSTYTAFSKMPKDESELASAIRNGLGIPMRSSQEETH